MTSDFATVVHTRYDQAFKQIVGATLEPLGSFGPELEVSPDPQRADGFFVPDPAKISSGASHYRSWYASGSRQRRQEGRQEGRLQLMLQLLRRRFGDLPQAIVARVEAADTQALEIFAARILVAKTAEEVVSDV